MKSEELNCKHTKTKALVVLTSPYVLIQLIWLKSLSAYRDMQWDVIVLNYCRGNMLEKIINNCKTSGLFQNIWIDERSVLDEHFIKKMFRILLMTVYKCFGARKLFCKRHIEKIVPNVKDYDEAIVSSDFFIDCGCLINIFPKEKISILEDGLCDYPEFQKSPKLKTLLDLAGWLLCKMGYMNYQSSSAYRLIFKETKKCIKYASSPQNLRYRNYCEIRRLFSIENKEQQDTYRLLIEKTFFKDYSIDLENADVIFFTEPFFDASKELSEVAQAYETEHVYLKERFADKKILIKKHPRDRYEYNWQDLNIIEKYQDIPAEIILPYIEDELLIICDFSTFLLSCISSDKDVIMLMIKNPIDNKYDECKDVLFKQFGISDSIRQMI